MKIVGRGAPVFDLLIIFYLFIHPFFFPRPEAHGSKELMNFDYKKMHRPSDTMPCIYFSAAKGESSVFRYFPRSANEPILCGSAFIRYSIVAMYRLSSSTCVPNPAAIIFLFACCQRRAHPKSPRRMPLPVVGLTAKTKNPPWAAAPDLCCTSLGNPTLH